MNGLNFMLYTFLFFFLDFSSFVLFNKWALYTLLAYFIIQQFCMKNINIFSFRSFYLPLFFLLLQDNFINGRMGIGLIYIVVIVFLMTKVRAFFDSANAIFWCLFLVLALLLQDFFIKKWLLGQNITLYSTIIKIFINITIAYLIFLGTRGNRSLTDFFR